MSLFDMGCLGIEDNSSEKTIDIKAFYPKSIDLEAIIAELEKREELTISYLQIPQKDWDKEWRKNQKPIKILDNFWVKPSFSNFEAPAGAAVITIDPKMSFGSGHHESTRICAKLMELIDPRGKTVLDVGTGSGILAILSERMGAKKVIAFDIDCGIRENLKENLENNATTKINAFIGPITGLNLDCKFQIILANMIKSNIQAIFDGIATRIDNHGIIILSGLLLDESSEMKNRIFKWDFRIIEEMAENEWWGCAIKK